jgi:predicted dehydrogenase
VTAAPIRWGILGTGGMARTFTEDLLALPDHAVVAVGSRSAAAARAFGAAYGIERCHGSYPGLAADEDIDVVYVATPQARHLADASLCLRAGRAVLVEKPFAMTAGEAAELAELARRTGRFAMEAMWMRFNPAVQAALGMVTDGVIGEVRAISADFGIDIAGHPRHRLWRPELGGGALLDLGVYPVTLATLVAGRPTRAEAVSVPAPTGVDAQTGILLRYPSGAVALLSCSLLDASPGTARIAGSRGQIQLDAPFFRPARLTLTRAGEEPEVIAKPFGGHGYTHQAAEVASCLRDGLTESPTRPLSATVALMQVLDRIRVAATAGNRGEPARRAGRRPRPAAGTRR